MPLYEVTFTYNEPHEGDVRIPEALDIEDAEEEATKYFYEFFPDAIDFEITGTKEIID